MKIAQEEVDYFQPEFALLHFLRYLHSRFALQIFGPVMSIIRFDNTEDLVEKANNTIYGLAAAVVTKDLDKALHVANNIRAGSVW